MVLKVHPDKGGDKEDAQKLQDKKEAWDKSRKSAAKNQSESHKKRNKPTATEAPAMEALEEPRKEYRINGTAVMLTYNGVTDVAQFERFVRHVRSQKKAWGVKHWCVTLEATRTGKLHIHLMLQFFKIRDSTLKVFRFDALSPRADVCDLLGEGFCRKKYQDSVNRAMFYVYADKIGTQRDAQGRQCTAGNYAPVWADAEFTYDVRGKWPENLWKSHKLAHETYESQYLYNCRDGVVYRKRNLDVVREHEKRVKQRVEMDEVIKEIREDKSIFRPFPETPPAVKLWFKLFEKRALRYPLLLVRGKSHTGKTEWAKSLFKCALELKIGKLEQFPDKMRTFERGVHDAIILDDLRDIQWLVDQQDKLQGKYDNLVEFGTTPSGDYAYKHWLYKIPIVVTFNFTTKNRALLEQDDFIGNPENRLLVDFPLPGA